ncbi:MAG: DUF559 domain-containing protein [Phycisphaerales bacterium]|nr:MAG: DUF559 domain-containing protein [Phycisphaerales bacterium]
MTGYRPSPSEKPPVPLERQTRLRRPLSPPEALLWTKVRNRQLAGLKFRRQHPLGPYIADFYCAAAKLVVELDGQQHGREEHRGHDARRDAWLREQEVYVLRFSVSAFMKNIDGTLARIRDVAQSRIGSFESKNE